LIIALAAWWYFLLPHIGGDGMAVASGVIAQALSAVLGIMIVANIFGFSKVDECRKAMRNAKPKYIRLLQEGHIDELRQTITSAIADSAPVEERMNLLDKRYDVSVLCGAADIRKEQAYTDSIKTALIKSGYSDKGMLAKFDDYVTSASFDEVTFLSLWRTCSRRPDTIALEQVSSLSR
jgi:hypothetical protein